MTAPIKDFSVNYVELRARSVAESKRFYAAAFGWPFEDYGPDYASWASGPVGGGLAAESPEGAERPLIILYATNLEDAVRRVQQAGGNIVRPIFSFPGGRRFHFTDPSGNELAIWSDK
jgi:predicted enzyme related to lactoylglutathione lyase